MEFLFYQLERQYREAVEEREVMSSYVYLLKEEEQSLNSYDPNVVRVPTSSGIHGKPGKSRKNFHAWKNHGI